MDFKYIAWCLPLLVMLPTIGLSAQTELELQQQIIQQQQQRQQDLRDRIEQQQKQHQAIDVQPSPEINKILEGPCFDIASIELNGADHLPPEIKQTIVAPFINQCIDLNKINQLLEAITNWYFDHGYVTSRAYVSAQDLSSRRLQITIVEGTIELIELSDPTSRINTYTAFPSHNNDLLNLRDIEQGLEQINRLQSNQATMDLVPGTMPGASVIQVKSPSGKPWVVSLSRDNSGQKSTGELMNSLFFSMDNPLGLNDCSYLNLQKDNAASNAGKANKSVALHWDMPLGYWNMGMDVGYFEYLSTIHTIGNQFESSGTNLSQKLFVSRIMYRDKDSKLKFRSSLERKKSQNFIEDVLLDSSRVLGIGNLGLEYDIYRPDQSQWQVSLDYYRGLSLFGAPKDKEQAADSPKAQFNKWAASIQYQQQYAYKLNQQTIIPVAWQSKLQLQHSNDRLFGSEQISIGSLYTVRGYNGSSIAAASGAYWRNDLTIPWRTPWGGKLLQSISPFIAFDIGTIRDREHNYSEDSYADLMGWATGAQLVGKHYTAKLVYARPLNTPQWLSVDQEQWYFNLSMNF